jgi:hypothetical protein
MGFLHPMARDCYKSGYVPWNRRRISDYIQTKLTTWTSDRQWTVWVGLQYMVLNSETYIELQLRCLMNIEGAKVSDRVYSNSSMIIT